MGKNEDQNRFSADDGRVYQIGFGTKHFMPQNGGYEYVSDMSDQYSYLSRGHLRRVERERELNRIRTARCRTTVWQRPRQRR